MSQYARLAKLWQSSTLVIITILLFISASRYIQGVDDRSLWFDEIWSADTVNQSLEYLFAVTYHIDVHPPLYYLTLFIWQSVAGPSVFAIRFMSVLLALLSTALMFRLGKDLFNKHVALAATTLYILSDFVLRYAQEARMYILLLTLINLAFLLYWRMIHHPTRRNITYFILAGIAMLYTHYWCLLTLFALGLHALIWHRKHVRHFIIIGMVFVPWLPVLFNQYALKRKQGEYIWWAISSNIPDFFRLLDAVFGKPNWLFFGLTLGASWFAYKKIQYRPQLKLLGLILFVQFLVAFTANAAVPLLSPRYMFASIPVVFLLVAYTITSLRPVIGLLVLSVLVGFALTTTHFYPFPGADWPGFAKPVVQQTDHDDVIFTSLDRDSLPLAYYSEASTNWQAEAYMIGRVLGQPERFGYAPDTFETLLQEHDGAWLLVQNWSDQDYHVQFERANWQKMADIVAPHNRFRMLRYEKIPETLQTIDTFGNMHLVDTDIAIYEDWITVNLLWYSNETIVDNYTVSIFLLSEDGALKAQHDNYPLNGASPTSSWEAEHYYFDSHALDITDLPDGDYQIGIKIYRFLTDDFSEIEILSPTSCQPNCEFITIANPTLE